MKTWKKALGAVALASAGLFSGAAAYAAVPDAVTTELATAKTDVATIGGAVLVVMIAVAVYRYMRRAL